MADEAAMLALGRHLADVARIGFDAMMDGEGDIVSGFKNKLQAAVANVTPAEILAEQHRKMAKPGSGTH